MDTLAERLQARLEPWQTASLLIYAAAIAAMFDQVGELVYDEGSDGDPDFVPGWGKLFDVDTCPAAYLPFLAQFVGVTIPANADESTARAIIRDEPGMSRGRPEAIIAAAKRNLTGNQSVGLFERTDASGFEDAWEMVIALRPSEVPNLQAVKDAVNTVKPGGILVNYIVSDAYTWVQAIHTWNGETMTWAQTTTIQP